MKINFKIVLPIILLLAIVGVGGYYFVQKDNTSDFNVVKDREDLKTKYPKSSLDTEKADRLLKGARICDGYEPQKLPNLKELTKQGKTLVEYIYVENGCIKTAHEVVAKADAEALIQKLRARPDVAAADYVYEVSPD